MAYHSEYSGLLKIAKFGREDIMGAVARGWCHDQNSHKIMDVDLAVAISDEVEDQVNKYAGLSRVTQTKEAGIGKTLLNEGSYLIPGVGTARMGYDGVKGVGKGVGSLFRGQGLRGLGQIGGGLANGAFALASLVPGGALLGRLARGVRLAGRAGKGARLARAAGRTGRVMSRMPGAKRLAARVGEKGLSGATRIASQARRVGRRSGGWKGMGGAMVAGVGAGMLEGAGAPVSMAQQAARAAATRPNKYQGLRRVAGMRPSTVPFGAMPGFRTI